VDNHHSLTVRARRRMQLSKLDMSYDRVVSEITDSPIATAEAILSLPVQNQSPKLRSACAGVLIEAISMLAGLKDQRVRKMKWLFHRLCDRELTPVPYPFVSLGPPSYEDEVVELLKDARTLMPYLRHPESTILAKRCLDLIKKAWSGTPREFVRLQKQLIKIIQLYEPSYDPCPEPNFFAQFVEHKDIVQYVHDANKAARYQRALDLFNKPPEGNA